MKPDDTQGVTAAHDMKNKTQNVAVLLVWTVCAQACDAMRRENLGVSCIIVILHFSVF